MSRHIAEEEAYPQAREQALPGGVFWDYSPPSQLDTVYLLVVWLHWWGVSCNFQVIPHYFFFQLNFK